MEIMTRKSFNIPQYTETQKFSGYCSTAQTYQFKVVNEEDGNLIESCLIGTIYDVIDVTDEAGERIATKIQLYPTWDTAGPQDILTEVLLDTITEATQIYVKFKPLYKAPKRQIDPKEKTFVFRFSNTDLVITPNDFVKISYREEHAKLKKGEENRRGVFGYITDISDNICKMASVSTFRGLFDIHEVEIPVSSIYAVFRYYVEASEFVRKETKSEEAPVEEESVNATVESADSETEVTAEESADSMA